MRRSENLIGIMGLALILLAVGLIVLGGTVDSVRAENDGAANEKVDKVKYDAEKAKADAEKAMAEAEKAIAEAERAIAEAQRAKNIAKKEKAKALERMIEAHRYPEDIAMTAPGSTTTAIFSHKKHTERERLRCTECHPKVFIMKVGKNVVKKGQLTMSEMKKGKYCGNCHNGHKAFSVSDIASCKKCHPEQKK
jgi:c(7)-type cytochrome triheme protein